MAEYECNGCGDEIKECSCSPNNNIGIDFDAINRLVKEIKNSSKELPPLKIENNKEVLEDDGEDGCFIDYSDLKNEVHGNTALKTETCFGEVNIDFDRVDDKTEIRRFETGATRDSNENKLEYARFNSPIVMKRFAEYMDLHRKQSDGDLREGDNWQKLFGDKHEDICMDSLLRHVMDVWLINKGFKNEAREDLESALCAIMFNVNAWLFKILKERQIEK